MTDAPSHHSAHAPQDCAVALEHVSKTYRIYAQPRDRLKQALLGWRVSYFSEHTALRPLSLEIHKGQTVGIIGVNGSGKSTLLQLITRTLTPTTGTLMIDGRVSALLELGAGFNPEFSGRENIFLNASIMGMSHEETQARYDDIVAFSGLDARMLEQKVSTYSSGMYVRLAFSVAIAVAPDILIVDEALAVGDEGFQRKCFARIRDLQEQGATILFVSHSARTIMDLCSHAIWLDGGELLMQGSPSQVVAAYHKMLFAPEEERPAIVDALRSASNAPQPPATPDTADNAASPETRIDYPANGGTLSDIRIHDMQGQLCHHWVAGESYQLTYRLRCDRAVERLRCSMMLKTMTGVELAGCLYHGESDMFDHVPAGTTLELCFTIPCTLSAGDYFINVGAVEEKFGQFHFIHRIVDAAHVKVRENPHLRDGTIAPRGCVDIGTKCVIKATSICEHA